MSISSIKENIKPYAMHVIFLISFLGVVGSLYMSEIEEFVPCPFCWWARIWMYPIVVVSVISILTADKFGKWYVAALAGIGILFSAYHNLLQLGVFSESESCVVGGTSCATPTIFTTIAGREISLELLGLLGFIAINVVVLSLIWVEKRNK
ncbi:disulfide bond formation protein B [Candidatus Dojkabacteria bacterium]|uniref:Disulfide bond formation protein B n=1 Tax=Candidatus Dojkabacteria bacterium TaxID=2099670 RepID=A0A955IEU8_9BACT|nr:disulfide bond formation protein B [Candidatus Dojkabacteria bacterium]